MRLSFATILLLLLSAPFDHMADANILIIGSEKDSSESR